MFSSSSAVVLRTKSMDGLTIKWSPSTMTVQCRKRDGLLSVGGLRECRRAEEQQQQQEQKQFSLRRESSRLRPEGVVEKLKFSLWRGEVRKSFGEKVFTQRSGKPVVTVSSSSDDHKQERIARSIVSRREWLLFSGSLAGVLAVPRNAHGLSKLPDLAESDLATDASLVTNANGDTEQRRQPAEDVKSWYRYRGEGFVIRVPPGYEDTLDADDEEDGSSPYGKRAKEKPFAARFASPDGDEVLTIVIKPVSRLRLSFFECLKEALNSHLGFTISNFLQTTDITGFGSIKEAAKDFVPAGAKIVSARIINSKASRVPRTYYMYEFLLKGTHFMLSAGVSKGSVFVLGASTPQEKWKKYGNRLQLASSTFYLP